MAKKQQRKSKPGRSASRLATPAAKDEEHIDGCGVHFHEHAATLDEHLPPARGGVEQVGRARRR